MKKCSLFICLLAFSNIVFSQQNFRLARSAGKLPMLAYGLGEDRLGGAKLGYIDTNIVLKLIDSTKDMYKVQLSQNHTAYIEKNYVKNDSTIKQKNFYLTNSWSIKGVEDSFDIVSISMDERLPYKTWMEVSPSKIMVDLYGVQSNTNWIQQLQTAKEVRNIYFNQVEDDVVRVTIELNHQQHWGYTASYRGKSFIIKIKHQPKKLDIRTLTIAIDAGHGGSNVGAGGICTKIEEKEYTLLFAKALEKYLIKQKVKVIMVRDKDTAIDNRDRVLFLQQQKPDILISLHLNSSSNFMAEGVSTYYKHIGFRPLTTAILKQMLRLGLKEFGNVGNFNFTPNAATDFPNSLVEIAFLSSPNDERFILNKKNHDAVAKKIYLGIVDFLKASK
jgi:N-acetylmuramoyl-L-alanine amidase